MHLGYNTFFRLYSDYYHEYGKNSRRKTMEPSPKHFHDIVVTAIQLYEECQQTFTLRSCVYDERIYNAFNVSGILYGMRGSRGVGVRESGPPTPPEKSQNIWFLSITGPDPLKSQRYQASIQFWAIIGTPVKRHLNE